LIGIQLPRDIHAGICTKNELRQTGFCYPEIIDALDQVLERFHFNRLAEVTAPPIVRATGRHDSMRTDKLHKLKS
jgi:hypothetical protein